MKYALAFAMLVLAPTAAAQYCPQVRLVGSAPGNFTGASLDLDGDVWAVSSNGATDVYRNVGGTWTLEQTLTDEGLVALDGDRLAIYVFETDNVRFHEFDGSAWNLAHTVPVGTVGAIALSGDVLVTSPSFGLTRAEVYEFSGGIWNGFQTLSQPFPNQGAHLPVSIALQGDLLVMGVSDALLMPGFGKVGGAAVYRRGATHWDLEEQFRAAVPEPDESMGVSAAVDGDTIALGTGFGGAHLFHFDGTSWTEQADLVPADASLVMFNDFGQIELVGDRVAFSAPDDDHVGPDGVTELDAVGVVYVYERVGSIWSEMPAIRPTPYLAGAKLGKALAMSGDRVAVGAPDHYGTRGVAYVFDLLEPVAEAFCTGKVNSVGCVPFVTWQGLPSTEPSESFLLRGNDLVPGEGTLLLYGFKKANLAFHGGRLCIKAPIQRLLPKAANPKGTPPCSGFVSRNFNSRIQNGIDPLLTAGQRVFAQWLQRDPLDPAGFGDSLSDAVTFAICP